MAQPLSAEQVKSVQVTSQGGRYTRETWIKYLTEQATELTASDDDVQAFAHLEHDFPGVKTVHVAHMLRLLLRTDCKDLAENVQIAVDKDTENGAGVLLLRKAQATTAETNGSKDDEAEKPSRSRRS